MSNKYYEAKEQDYFLNVRVDVVSLIPVNANQKILEIGAGGANTLVYIKENKIAGEVMGVELMKIPGSNQEHPLVDKFQVANIEQEDIQAPESYFDVIICADVLEHLIDPWAAVDKISRHLKKDGLLLVSIPNIREWKTLFKILFKGDFAYLPEGQGGIMDKTHLRFFCKKNVQQLLTTSSLSPIYCEPNFKILPQGKKRRILNLLSFRLFENLLTIQYLLIAKKK
jgi:2-polyprenyl-3-methyl-5-hydroxy-6-metoxy-1,4-benzoquinol methylase